MSTCRAKFQCKHIKTTPEGQEVVLHPVSEGSSENEKFYKWTPGGSIELSTINKDIKFIPGKEYYVDFTLAE